MIQQILATVFLFVGFMTIIQVLTRIVWKHDIPGKLLFLCAIGWAGFVATMWIF